MTTNYRINGVDFDDLFVRKDLFTEGGLWLWGANGDGQLGDNNVTSKSSPVQTVSGGANWKQIACGGHTAGIKSDGTLWLWGTGTSGQLGDNTITSKSSPVQTVSGGTNWKQVSVSGAHSAAVKSDGTLWTWGIGSTGQLGDNTVNNRSSPIQTVAAGSDWRQVAAGGIHTAAVKTDGTLWLWGRNTEGQLGDNSVVSKSSPVQTVSGGTNWKQVSLGTTHSAAIKTDGTLWTWGSGATGRLGDNTVSNKSSPVQTVAGGTNWKQVSAGDLHTASVKTDGTLWTWGQNATYGALGDNTVSNKSSPVQTVAAGTNWKQVSAGTFMTCAIKTDGTLWVWGRDLEGQLGDNAVNNKSSPVQTVSGGTNWKQVSTANRGGVGAHAAGIREDYWN